jgi:hypothetical protein
MFIKADCYRIKTYHPGFKPINPAGDEEYAKHLAWEKSGELRAQYADKSGVNRHARNFHANDMLFSNYSAGKIKSECLVGEHGVAWEVPMYLRNGRLNEEGIIDVLDEPTALEILNHCRMAGWSKAHLDTEFGKDIEDKSKLVTVSVKSESDDISSGKKRPQPRK